MTPAREPIPSLALSRRWTTFALLGIAWILVVALALHFGASALDWSIALNGEISPNPDRIILLADRLPRAMLASAVGASLALVGTAFQSLMRNPLADPFVLGTSGGAALGATLAIVFGAAISGLSPALGAGFVALAVVPAAAFVGALLSLLLLTSMAGRGAHYSPARLLLMGVVFNFFASSMITLLKAFSGAVKAQELLLWLLGTVSPMGAGPLSLGAPLALALVGGVWLSRHALALNALTLGDEAALALGIDVPRVRRHVFIASSLLVGAAVSVSGLIGFVGLVVPHAARLVLGPDHRLLLPASALVGASFLLGCDLLARLAFPLLSTEAPVGVVTAFIGGPVFLWMLARGGNRSGPSHPGYGESWS